MKLSFINKNIPKSPCFNGRENYKKISTTPSVPAEKIVQFYGASSSIPTGLNSSYITHIQQTLEGNAAIQNAMQHEVNQTTIELLKKTSPNQANGTLMRMRDYALAKEMSGVVAEEGYGILTGDATGAMEAAKLGAKEKGGYCVGVALKGEKLIEHGLDELYVENTWHTRLERFNNRARAPFTIVMPGGEGSISKLWGKMIQNLLDLRDGSTSNPKVILVDKNYWQPMIDWMKGSPSERGYIKSSKHDMLKLIDNPEELRAIIRKITDGFVSISSRFAL